MEHEYAIPDPDAEKNPYVVGQFLNPDVDPSEAFDAAFEYARTKQSEQRNTDGDIVSELDALIAADALADIDDERDERDELEFAMLVGDYVDDLQ